MDNNDGYKPGLPGPEQAPPPLQLPALRTFRVRYGDVETDKIITEMIQSHGVTHENSGALSFIEATIHNGQVVPRIRRAFREWMDFEEIAVSPPSLILH